MATKTKIGLWQTSSLVLGNMIGAGIFLLPASLAAYGGISIVGWLVSAAAGLTFAKVFSDLSKQLPKIGGPYVFTKEGFGDFPAFLVAWGYWIAIICTNAAIAVTMVSYLSVFFPILNASPIAAVIVGLGTIWLLTWVNNRGVGKASAVQLVTTVLKVIPLILVATIGIFYIEPSHFIPFNLSGASDLSAITSTATLTLFAFLGIESATIPADNIENPERTIPLATKLGTWAAIIIYILGSVAVLGIIPPTILQHSTAPFADAAAVIWGESARYVVAGGAVVATFGALNGWIIMQGQIPLAAAQDQLFPAFFGRLNQRGAPALGIIFSSVLISILMIMNYNKGLVKTFEFMILLSTLTCLVPYLFSTATHVLFSLRRNHKYGWVVGSLGFIFSMWAVIGSGEEVVFWGFLMLMMGIPFFVWLRR